jgi:FMN-dependent oxidoreductase (nitrilotriacetate monooxygenase family)
MPRLMKLNLHGNWAGGHVEAWRQDRANGAVSLDLGHYQRLARTAERGLFDAVFYASGLALHEEPGRPAVPGLDPVLLATSLAAVTERIGFVATVSTTFNEPYVVARTIASLDHISGGRAGWNVVTTYDENASRNFGLANLPPKDERYEKAREFVEVILKLWDSWGTAAFVRDHDGKLAIDASDIHPIDHAGRYFKVRGPLQTPRSLQGRPVLFQAGASEDGKSFAARIADGVFCVALDLDGAKNFYSEMKERVKAAGRNPDHVQILPGTYVYLGSTESEARRILEEQSATPDALNQLAIRLSTPVETLSLDETVAPAILDKAASNPRSQGHTLSVVNLFRQQKLTVREFLVRQPSRGPHRVLSGTPKQVADSLATWFLEKAADGFNIGNLSHEGLDLFVDHVVPKLQERGIYRREYTGRTLRENFLSSRS